MANEKPPKLPSKLTIASARAKLRSMTLEQLKSLNESLEKKLALENLPDFLSKVLTPSIPKYKHILEWCSLVDLEKNLLVEASRDHFKSSFFSYGYPLFKVQKVKDPSQGFGIALFSYTENQSRENLKRIRQQIETNEWLKWLLPKSKSSVWDSDNLDCSNGCWIKCYGFGSAFRGRHPKIIVIDDPCKDHGAMSIEQQVQYFSGVIVPAAKSGSQLIVTGNPVDKLDFLNGFNPKRALLNASILCLTNIMFRSVLSITITRLSSTSAT